MNIFQEIFFFSLHTVEPNVIKPTREFSGIKLKLINKASFNGSRSCAGSDVSTTSKKTGGNDAARGSRYSIVVKLGINSAVKFVSVIPE